MSQSKIKLHFLVLVPFLVIYLAISISLTWWSYRAAVHEAEDLGESLHEHVGALVRTHLDRLFDTPEQVLEANVGAIEAGQLDLHDALDLEHSFTTQVRAFPYLTNLAFGSAQGDYTCAYRSWREPERVNLSTAEAQGPMLSYAIDDKGIKSQIFEALPDFRVTQRPWYQVGAASESSVWYPVYLFYSGDSLGIGMAHPVRDQASRLLGVLAADISLHGITRFLSRLDLQPGGVAFLMDSAGQLVADSSGGLPLQNVDGVNERVLLTASDHAPLRIAAEQLLGAEEPPGSSASNGRFEHEDRVYLLHSFRYERPGGLELIAGILVPRGAYVEPLTAGVNRRVLLAVVLVLVGLVLGLWISAAISRPVRDLNAAVVKMASGDWTESVPETSILEISALSESFTEMASHLHTTLDSLEQRVEERTAELEHANARLDLLSRTDKLTNLANRRQFDEELAKEWNRSRREAKPLSLLICDVDSFKAYNDRYGHPAGDECLRAVASTLSQLGRRGTDLVARIGGEEFALLLPGVDLERAHGMAQEARRRTEELKFVHEDSAHGCVTISIGVACRTAESPDREPTETLELVEAADQALYAAKHNGRNRVEVAVETPGSRQRTTPA